MTRFASAVSLVIMLLPLTAATAEDVTYFEADLKSANVVRGGAVASTATGTGRATLKLTQPSDMSPATLEYNLEFSGLDLNGFQTIGVTDDDVTAIHIHDLNRLIDGSENSGPDTADTLHVLNVFGVPRGGDDADMMFDAEAATVSGIWSDADASLPGLDAPTTTLTASLPMLMNEELFMMVHTTEFQRGAIGGSLRLVPEPSSMWPAIIGVLIVFWRVVQLRRTRAWAITTLGITFCLSAGSPYLMAQQGEWADRARLIEANSEMAVAELDGKIYVLGGYPSTRVSVRTVQVYDTSTDTWELTTPLPRPTNHPMASSVNGKLYFIGGQVSASGSGPFLDRVYEYDPATEEWTARADMPTARGGGVSAVIDGKIYVAGGRPPRGHDFAVYDPAEDTWTPLPDMPTDRNHLAAAAIDGKMYVVGGRFGAGFSSRMTNALEVYDPDTNEWLSAAPMPTIRGGLNAVGANGCLHVFGGEGSSGMFGEHEVYDPFTDTWYSMDDMPTAVHGVTGLAFVDGWIHLPGGGTRTGGSSGSRIHQVYRPQRVCGQPVVLGDLNGNGLLDIADIDALSLAIVEGAQEARFDMNGDGTVDGQDHDFWVSDLRATWLGDSNLDGEFNSGDLVAVFEAGEYEDNTPNNSGWGTGDWNGDGDFGSGDLVTAFTDGGYEQGPKPAAAVPEPAACLLLMTGLIGMAIRRRHP